jgi:hypothetical protein
MSKTFRRILWILVGSPIQEMSGITRREAVERIGGGIVTKIVMRSIEGDQDRARGMSTGDTNGGITNVRGQGHGHEIGGGVREAESGGETRIETGGRLTMRDREAETRIADGGEVAVDLARHITDGGGAIIASRHRDATNLTNY